MSMSYSVSVQNRSDKVQCLLYNCSNTTTKYTAKIK